MNHDATIDPDPPRRALVVASGFAAFNLAVKLCLLRLNFGEYTDGILQLEVFSLKPGLYPPLYGALGWLGGCAGMDAESAGKLVSILSGALAVFPVYFMARGLSGASAARIAALLYTISPLIMRWSGRVMSDSLFLCLSSASLCFMLESWKTCSADDPEKRVKADRRLALASVFGALSALTRYQGALLAPLLVITGGVLIVRCRSLPWRAVCVSLFWAALPAWIVTQGFVHGSQFASRTTGQRLSTFLAWWNTCESFILVAPYYFTYPVALFALFAFFRLDYGKKNVRAFLWLWGLWTGMLLILQSAFGSFQYRYMMPVLPAFLALAGAGCAWMEARFTSRAGRGAYAVIFRISIIYTVVFCCASLVFQRETLRDQRQAAQFIRDTIPMETPVFANEQYGEFTNLGCVKLSWWSGRGIQPVAPWLPPSLFEPPSKFMPPGSVVVLGNMYGGDEAMDHIIAQLQFYYHLRDLTGYSATVFPLLDDIMLWPITNQNPLAWVLRYTPQHFATRVYSAEKPRSAEEIGRLMKRTVSKTDGH